MPAYGASPEKPQGFLGWAGSPLVSKETIAPVQDFIDSPSVGRSPTMARIQGFGAGALEGLRSLATPANLAAAAIPGGLAMRGGGKMAATAASGADDALRALHSIQRQPKMWEANSMIEELGRNLSRFPNK